MRVEGLVGEEEGRGCIITRDRERESAVSGFSLVVEGMVMETPCLLDSVSRDSWTKASIDCIVAFREIG